ncbi:hypothetical protein Q5H93_00530 [Hymenobacter sp. ASUV-10]|uniref:AraC family transcriptional regulator n=1 Tax=Hymenobacter aranciens TaxID=3063996 RepID=A0ABT9B4R3_9BACT|nr:hypothetical protein [Hymenobacter sp. ASUV-10]MDO7873200.1 hypothetical protein [Hymenobacter sp. ASUV-10]
MRFFLPVVLLLTLAGLGFYAWLGGFRSATTSLQTNTPPVLLAGQYFRGPAQAAEFGPLFRRAKEVQDARQLRGDLANLYFDNPEKAHDTIRAFVGLAVADSSQTLPTGWRYRVLPSQRRVVVARVAGVGYLLAPDKLYPAIQEFIAAEKLTQRGFYFERFAPNDAAEVWAEVK